MRPKGKLFALLAIFAAIGLVTATGAFTSVEATRTAEVNVAGDAAALLQLQPHNSANGYGEGVNPNAGPENSFGYAQLNSNDELVINLGGFGGNVAGVGPNVNATTEIRGVFNVTNAGNQQIDLTINDDGQHDTLVTFYNGSDASSGSLEDDELGDLQTMAVGDTKVIHIQVDTTGQSLTNDTALINSITINATASSS